MPIFSYLRGVLCSFSGVTVMLWVPPMGSVTYAPASVSASLASLVSTVSTVRSTTLGLDLKAANVRCVGGIQLQVSLDSTWNLLSRMDLDCLCLATWLVVRAVPKSLWMLYP